MKTAPALWRERDFALFWGGQAVSLTGSAVTAVAVPLLAAITLHAGPLELGLLEACVWLPYLGLPLLAGVVLDRHRRRQVLLCCDGIRLVVLTTIVVLALTEVLGLAVLAILVAAAQSATVFADIAKQAYLPSLVDHDQLLQATSATGAAQSAGSLAGPGLAGILTQALGAPIAIAVDACSYVVSFLTLTRIRRPEPPLRVGPQPVRSEVIEGFRFVWRLPEIRYPTCYGLLFNGFYQVLMVPFLLYALHDVGTAPSWWGLILGLGGVGGLMGSLAAPAAAQRLPTVHRAVVLAGSGQLLALTIPVFSAEPTAVVGWGVAWFIVCAASGLINALVMTTRLTVTPVHLRGRVLASIRMAMYGSIPVGAVLGGALAHAVGNRNALTVGAVGLAASTCCLLPLWRQPDPVPAVDQMS